MRDLVCFSHLRWNFVYQRPQHLLSRAAKSFRVFYVEEFIWSAEKDAFTISKSEGVHIVKPSLCDSNRANTDERVGDLLERLFSDQRIRNYLFWYYTPMAVPATQHFSPAAVVYDCMDELSAFRFADARLIENERKLFRMADVVFTGGKSLYHAKRNQHKNVSCFPSSIDYDHFVSARTPAPDPIDQENIPYPRIGFFGVIDERFDTELLREAAGARPDLQFILLGPVVKIDPNEIPDLPNVHRLGQKSYNELPAYIAGWDAAMLPFAINDSTKYISPTKTPEYLAAGRPVISTAVKDVVDPYGESGLVHIANTAAEFVTKTEQALKEKNSVSRLAAVDEFLADNSWDNTWEEMKATFEKFFTEAKIVNGTFTGSAVNENQAKVG